MIIYGSRMYFKKNLVTSYGQCEYCGSYTKQKSYQASKFGHIYFIPLIPMGGKKQVLNECNSCSMGAHIPVDQLDPLVDGVKEKFKTWIMAIQEGQTEVEHEPGGEKVNVGLLISGILEELYCLNEIKDVNSITTILDSQNMSYEKSLVLGRWNDIQGKLDQSKLQFESAHKIRPEEPAPLYQMGIVAARNRDIPGAETAFHRYLKLEPDDINAYVELASLYEGKKDFPKIVETYDMIYTLNPAVVSDKGMKKIYKKACKKSGVQGKFLNQM